MGPLLKMTNVYLITGAKCSQCDTLKQMLKLMKLEVDKEIDAYSMEGSAFIGQVGARSIPVLLRVNGDGGVIDYVVGTSHSDKRFREVVNG